MVVVVIVVLIAHLTAINITTPISDIKDNQAPPPSSSSSSRRKSLVGLTDEELMALDPQFQTTKSKIMI